MKEKKAPFLPPMGSTSLLVIFGVLCLTVFSLLSLSTVLAQQRLSQAAAQSVKDWHSADLQAQEIFAELRSGQIPEEVSKTPSGYRYTVTISQNRFLDITLTEEETGWVIQSWKTLTQPEEISQTLPLWQGSQ